MIYNLGIIMMFRTQIIGYFPPRLNFLRVHTGFHHLHTHYPPSLPESSGESKPTNVFSFSQGKNNPCHLSQPVLYMHCGECIVGTLSPSILCSDKKEEMLLVLNLSHWTSWDSPSQPRCRPIGWMRKRDSLWIHEVGRTVFVWLVPWCLSEQPVVMKV